MAVINENPLIKSAKRIVEADFKISELRKQIEEQEKRKASVLKDFTGHSGVYMDDADTLLNIHRGIQKLRSETETLQSEKVQSAEIIKEALLAIDGKPLIYRMSNGPEFQFAFDDQGNVKYARL